MHIQDIARIILMDPEKIIGHAQSGAALKVLFQPMIEIIEEMQGPFEDILNGILIKMAVINLMAIKRGLQAPITIPAGYVPKSFNFVYIFPEVISQTMQDLQAKVNVGVSAANASIISRETVLTWLANDFGIEDIEAEIKKIEAQPVINPFGAF